MIGSNIRQLADPRGEMVVFHSEDEMDTQWIRCEQSLVVEVQR